MDQSYNDSIRLLLDLADRLIVLLKDTPIKVHRIASFCMQSNGKSSTLESITHISLPKLMVQWLYVQMKFLEEIQKEKNYPRLN